MNRACTIAHVWWSTNAPVLTNDVKRQQNSVQLKLTRARGYLAGQLVTILGLRFAPDLRFYIDQSTEKYEEFVGALREKEEEGNMGERMMRRVQALKALTPSEIAKIRKSLKSDEERAQFDATMSREALLAEELKAQQQQLLGRSLQDYVDKLPKGSERKQRKLADKKREQDLLIARAGCDPSLTAGGPEQIPKLIDDYLLTETYKIPNPRNRPAPDSAGKRVRHNRDPDGKKIKRPKKNRSAAFWSNLPNA
jgi:hypothetical protein